MNGWTNNRTNGSSDSCLWFSQLHALGFCSSWVYNYDSSVEYMSYKNLASVVEYSPFWHVFHSDGLSGKYERANGSASFVQGPGVEKKWQAFQIDACESHMLRCLIAHTIPILQGLHISYFSHFFLVSLILSLLIAFSPPLDSLWQLYEVHFTYRKIHLFKVHGSLIFNVFQVIEPSPPSNFRISSWPPKGALYILKVIPHPSTSLLPGS